MQKNNEKDISKLTYINKLEKNRVNEIEVETKKKYFVTFPYPYMNGKLHLGHLFSISKSDFMSYYMELKGYNVLFPLAFHCTGMPISALAKKLEEELKNVKTDISVSSIIKSFGFEDVSEFTDPKHWVRTFPTLCKNSLEKFGANIDWRRSFITTDLNKYYDSFIKWQFELMKKLGYLSFGKRYSIFCPLDNQACLDDDRRKGENVKPKLQVLCKLRCGDVFILSRYVNQGVPTNLVCSKEMKAIMFTRKNETYLSEEIIYENLKYQCDNLRFVKQTTFYDEIHEAVYFNDQSIKVTYIDKNVFELKTKADDCTTYKNDFNLLSSIEQNIIGKSIDSNLSKDANYNETEYFVGNDKFIYVYLPEDEVISRSGCRCVVALIDQWYIDYSNENWKSKVRKCLNEIVCEDDTRAKLFEGVDWINNWGFSRSFGLGTKIPWDKKYLIDSLSDSTIYMAFYTVKHYLFRDLEGLEEIFPSTMLCNSVWEYIFLDGDLVPELSQYIEILEKCKLSFKYFYPVDLRVSGKDLIKNHLLFFIFNHVAIFDEKYWPRRIFTNGHLLLNSQKMSKSTGNFLTVDDALTQYGQSATRMCLAVCGDTNEDANFLECNANSYILKIYNFVKSLEDFFEDYSSFSSNQACEKNVDVFLAETLSINVKETIAAFEDMKYSDVIRYGFFENIHLINIYKSLKGDNINLIRLVYKSITQLMYPIIPNLCRTLIERFFDSDFSLPVPMTTTNNMLLAFEYLKRLVNNIVTNKSGKTKSSVKIIIGDTVPEWKLEVMKFVDNCNCPRNEELKKEKGLLSSLLQEVAVIFRKHSVNVKKGNMFFVDYAMSPHKYEKKYDELEILSEFKFYIENLTNKKVVITNGNAEPLSPVLQFFD